MTSPQTPTRWPYPSYSDRRWLGGEQVEDRSLAAVIKILRATVSEAGDPVSTDPEGLLAGLARLAEIAERVEWAMLSIVGESRCQTVSWQAIGTALGVTKQAAQQRFSPYVKEALEQAAQAASETPD
jgi:hypothetical protein